MPDVKATSRLKDLWVEEHAKKLAANQLALLRYRSNLLGADLRITNFGGGNTSSKIELPDPFGGKSVRVLAVKGSGGDIGSQRRPLVGSGRPAARQVSISAVRNNGCDTPEMVHGRQCEITACLSRFQHHRMSSRCWRCSAR